MTDLFVADRSFSINTKFLQKINLKLKKILIFSSISFIFLFFLSIYIKNIIFFDEIKQQKEKEIFNQYKINEFIYRTLENMYNVSYLSIDYNINQMSHFFENDYIDNKENKESSLNLVKKDLDSIYKKLFKKKLFLNFRETKELNLIIPINNETLKIYKSIYIYNTLNENDIETNKEKYFEFTVKKTELNPNFYLEYKIIGLKELNQFEINNIKKNYIK